MKSRVCGWLAVMYLGSLLSLAFPSGIRAADRVRVGLYQNNPKIYTISLALRSFSDPGGLTDWGAIFAMSFLSLVPVLALFVAFQRYLVQGIASTGIKG